MQGMTQDGNIYAFRIMPQESAAANPAFDVTPARLVTGIITELGVFDPAQIIAMSTNDTLPVS